MLFQGEQQLQLLHTYTQEWTQLWQKLQQSTVEYRHKLRTLRENAAQRRLQEYRQEQAQLLNPQDKQKKEKKLKERRKQKKQKKYRKEEKPEKPKPFPSAFQRYARRMKSMVAQQLPRGSSEDNVLVILNNMWMGLPKMEKEKYEERERQDRMRYDAKMIEYLRVCPEKKSSKQRRLEKAGEELQ